MELNLAKEIVESTHVLATLLSPSQPGLGVLIAGEEYYKGSKYPIIYVYLIHESESEWQIQKELESFKFSSYNSATQFVKDLPQMSALDLLLLMNGWQKKNFFLQ